MTRFAEIQNELLDQPAGWLVTGAAGFIGSHLVERLLRLNQKVIGLDNFSTGKRSNLDDVQALVTPAQWTCLTFIEGDITRLEDCRQACAGVDYVLHQAALGSVPRSIEDPLRTHANNVDGFINMLIAARDAKVRRLVYASSSSVYGDSAALPKVESRIGRALSPYATTKLIDEIYADVFSRCYSLSVIGLRYFNVFGARQDPAGAYAAVIPKWFDALLRNQEVLINGDGKTSRDFCYIADVVQANLLAATAARSGASSEIYNVACGERTTLLTLFQQIRARVAARDPRMAGKTPVFRDERAGDVRHSLADISEAKARLGYDPTHSLVDGLAETAAWYTRNGLAVPGGQG